MKDYDPEKGSSYIMYLDTCNLYGWAMSQPLPKGDFKWVDIETLDLKKYNENDERDLILELDREYPEEVRDEHNDCT